MPCPGLSLRCLDSHDPLHFVLSAQEQLQLTPAQRQQMVRLRNEYLAAMEELLSERAALNTAIQASAAHTEENAQVAEDHAKVRGDRELMYCSDLKARSTHSDVAPNITYDAPHRAL